MSGGPPYIRPNLSEGAGGSRPKRVARSGKGWGVFDPSFSTLLTARHPRRVERGFSSLILLI
jgi:hypothetical protein